MALEIESFFKVQPNIAQIVIATFVCENTIEAKRTSNEIFSLLYDKNCHLTRVTVGNASLEELQELIEEKHIDQKNMKKMRSKY